MLRSFTGVLLAIGVSAAPPGELGGDQIDDANELPEWPKYEKVFEKNPFVFRNSTQPAADPPVRKKHPWVLSGVSFIGGKQRVSIRNEESGERLTILEEKEGESDVPRIISLLRDRDRRKVVATIGWENEILEIRFPVHIIVREITKEEVRDEPDRKLEQILEELPPAHERYNRARERRRAG